ncbi:unnamed protein product [Rotaria socialis]|uniref:Tyrosine specific protein phosphatases domain-containing protein n=1 Tax=Rotaria socialis TaxID=392032 RepID=A0A820G259_9BILA|nr:unnamed protein product [Rotaria socialis]CAF4271494.1 unnamed protein product [Rotaria socialis]
MLFVRSPSIIFAFTCSIVSISLTILSFDIVHTHPQQQSQLLIILPPLNIIFLFLSALIWTERHFRLTYVPTICLFILLTSSLALTIISYLLLSTSIIFYLNFIFYLFFSILLSFIILTIIISFFCSLLTMYRYQNMPPVEQQNNQLLNNDVICQFDKFTLKSNEKEFFLFVSKLPFDSMTYDMNIITNNLNRIEVDTILILNEMNKSSNMNMTNDNHLNIYSYSMQMTQANIEHIIYPINSRYIPKSISDYMQFLYAIILNFNQFNRNRLFIHCAGDMGRIGMTIVCFELLYELIMDENQQQSKQNLIERVCHYPLLLDHCCRVCKAISNVRKIRPRGINNPLQILYVHEFYARLKTASYMQQIKHIANQKFTMSNFEEIQ